MKYFIPMVDTTETPCKIAVFPDFICQLRLFVTC